MTGLELWMFWTSISECEVPPIEIAAFVARLPHANLVLRGDGAIGGYWRAGEEQYRLRHDDVYLPLNPSITRAFKRRVINGWYARPSPELIAWANTP